MNTTSLKIKVIIGSTRQNRFSEKPANYIFDELGKKENVQAELLDLRDFPMPFFNDPVSPIAAKDNFSNEVVKQWAAKIKDGDAFIIVSPEYNHGYTAVLKNALDSIFYEWNHKPVGFVSYGNTGGARAVEQLRQVAIELDMHPIRNAIHIPVEIYRAVMNEKIPVNPELFKPLREGPRGDRVESFFNELIKLASTLKAAQ